MTVSDGISPSPKGGGASNYTWDDSDVILSAIVTAVHVVGNLHYVAAVYRQFMHSCKLCE